MHGNVWEWVQDCWHDSYADASPNGGTAPEFVGCSRVYRGGSYVSPTRALRSATRGAYQPDFFVLGAGLVKPVIGRWWRQCAHELALHTRTPRERVFTNS